ncbi:hypothetical protein DITRI_Ditri02bG0113000 [Diplodiscus trichospermus]
MAAILLFRYFGRFRTWTGNGCFFERERVVFSHTIIRDLKKNLVGYMMRQDLTSTNSFLGQFLKISCMQSRKGKLMMLMPSLTCISHQGRLVWMKGDELENAKETPEEMVGFKLYMCNISCEPSIKKYVHGIYMENAVVSTCPTHGKIAIDSFHQFAGVKWLCKKPLSRFQDAQYLLIQKAEEEKLLQVTFNLPEKYLDELIEESNCQYLSNGVSKSAQQWNEQRKLILSDALFGFLLPSMEKEAKILVG